MDRKIVIVYALSSSEDGVVRYIGQTTQRMQARLNCHRQRAKSHPDCYLSRWIKSTESVGHRVQMTVLVADAIWNETEMLLIRQYRMNGAKLVNGTDGGDGVLGRVVTMEQRERISKGNKGKPKSAEHRAKLKEARSRYRTHLGAGAKISAALKGHRPKNLDALHAAQCGRPCSEEKKRKISAALKGRKRGW